MILYFSVDPPHRWVIVDRRNRVLEEGLADTLGTIPVRHRRITRSVGVVPGELVTIHALRIPARSRAKAAAAMPYMLEESVASDIEALQFRLLKWVRGGTSRIAVMSNEVVEHWHGRLREFPEPTDALIPEYLLLPRHPDSDCTVAADGRGRLVIRSGEMDGLVIGEHELELWWDEIEDTDMRVAVNLAGHARTLMQRGASQVREWDIGTHFGAWLRHDHQVPQSVDLRPQGSDRNAGRVPRRWAVAAAALLVLAVLVRVGVDAYDYARLSAAERRLDRQAEEILKKSFPDITRVVEPRVQMEQRMAALKSAVGSGFLSLLAVVADAVPGTRATVEEITFRDQTLLITCNTSDFEALDGLKQRFDGDRRATVELVSSGSRENSVSGRFRLDLARR